MRMNETVINYSIPAEIHQRIRKGLRAEIERNGSASYSDIGGRIMKDLQINWTDYAGGISKLSDWLKKYFTEFEPTNDLRGIRLRENVTLAEPKLKVTPKVRQLVAEAVNETMVNGTYVMMPPLGAAIKEKSVERKQYVGGNSLMDWICGMFPGMEKDETDTQRLNWTGEKSFWATHGATASGGTVTHTAAGTGLRTYPAAEKRLSQIDLDENIRHMHAVCHMSYWSNNVKELRRYTGCTGNDTRIWSGIVAQQLTDTFLGRDYAFQGTLEDESPCAAFYSGADTQDGRPIYCIAIENPNPGFQPMMLKEFCWPDKEDSPMLGKWLRECVAEQVAQMPSFFRDEVRSLEERCVALETLRRQLIEQLEQLHQGMQTAGELPLDVVPTLERYADQWRQISSLCENLDVPKELTDAQQILQWCGDQNVYAGIFKKLRDTFAQMIQNLRELPDGSQMPEPVGDLERLEQLCDGFEDDPDISVFQNFLLPYQQLCDLMYGGSKPELMQQLFNQAQQLHDHFGFYPMTLFGSAMMPHWQLKAAAHKDYLRTLQNFVGALDRAYQSAKVDTCQKRQLPDPQVLLDAVCNNDVMQIWNACGGENPLETLILEDRLPEAQEFSWDSDAMAEAGYDEQCRQQISQRLGDAQSLPEGYSFYHIGLRLSHILGAQNDTAERYLLMGMFTDREDCCTELLRIYRQTNRQECFVALWERYGTKARYDQDNYLYYMQYLHDHAPEKLQAYLSSHVYLYHLPAFAQVTGAPAAEQWEPNDLEKALIANDCSFIRNIAAEPGVPEALGYEPEQISRISQMAVSGDCPEGDDPFSIGMRIYCYQGNLHGLAEGYMWQGLALDPRTDQSNKLVCLLAEENRWQECIRLYECYQSYSGISNEAHRCYLLSLLYEEPIRAQQEIRQRLQHFLALAHRDERAVELVRQYCGSGSEESRAFYESLIPIMDVLTDDFPRSVLLHDRSLRDLLISQTELQTDTDMDEAWLANAKAVYQSGDYAKGVDAESVALRAYAFLDDYHGIAERLARFSLPAQGAVELLWELACTNGDTQEQQLLLDEYEPLRWKVPHAYSLNLFNSGRYGDFLQWMEQYQQQEPEGSILPEERLQLLIAMLRQNPNAAIELPLLSEASTAGQIGCIVQLTATLAQAGRTEEAQTLLLDNFELLLRDCSAEDLRRIVTADGRFDEDALLQLQSRAWEREEPEAALFCYNVLKVGQLEQEAHECYVNYVEGLDQATPEEQLLSMQVISKLYPEETRALTHKMYQVRVDTLLGAETYTKETQLKLAETLEECPLDAEDVEQLLQRVLRSAYATGDAVVRSVATLTEGDQWLQMGLEYLHQAAMTSGRKSGITDVLSRKLCQRYVDAMDRDLFPRDLCAEAEMLCRRIILGDRHRFDVAFCLYRLEMLMENRYRAECVLRFLSRQNTTDLGALYSAVEAAMDEFWQQGVNGMRDSFRSFVAEHTPDEIIAYAEFNKIFVYTPDEDWNVMHNHVQNMRQQKNSENAQVWEYSTCTETDAEALVKVLYAAPDKADYWWGCTTMPGLSPQARGKLLKICGKKNPTMFKECARFCAGTGLDAMLLTTLQEWIGMPSPAPKHCRAYLADTLEQQPDFFARWTQQEDVDALLQLLELLCIDMSSDMLNLQDSVAHRALVALSSIAVAIDRPDAIGLLKKHLADALMYRNPEVGVATVLTLLMNRRLPEARELLVDLHYSNTPTACKQLVEELYNLSDEELDSRTQSEEHRTLWAMLLPDGNRPAVQDIQQFLMDTIRQQTFDRGAEVLRILLDFFPGDFACCNGLYTLCKYDIRNRIGLLHRALCGLVGGNVKGNTYFRHNFLWQAKLLAALNVAIHAQGLEETVLRFNKDYDFTVPTGSYCQSVQASFTAADLSQIRNLEDQLEQSLCNLHSQDLNWKCRGILCWVTGDWADFLHEAWNVSGRTGETARVRESLCIGGTQAVRESGIGFCRSLLRAAVRLEKEEQIPFVQWVWHGLHGSAEIPYEGGVRLRGKMRQTALAYDLLKNNVVEQSADLSLELPLEEYSLQSMIFEDYILPRVCQQPVLMYNRLWLLGAVIDHPQLIMYQYHNPAHAAFRTGDDVSAAVYFQVMQNLICRGVMAAEDTFYRLNRALLKANARITRLRAGDPVTAQEVGSRDFNIWSCVNMTVAMLSGSRGNEALRMTKYFAYDNQKLARAIIQVIQPDMPEQDKIALLRKYPAGPHKAFLAFLMRASKNHGNNVFESYLFKTAAYAREAWTIFRKEAENYPKLFTASTKNGKTLLAPDHFLLTNLSSINTVSYKQLPLEEAVTVPEPESETAPEEPQEVKQEAAVPGFAANLQPLSEEESLETLIGEHGRLLRFHTNFAARLELSRKIYQISLAADAEPVNQLPALIRFGLDYYDNLNLDDPEEYTRAFEAVMELVRYVDGFREDAGEDTALEASIRELETSVENTIIYSLLNKEHLDIHSLVKRFSDYRESFEIILAMVRQDRMRNGALAIIYTALDGLIRGYTTDSKNISVIRAALRKAKEQIGTVQYGAWQNLKRRLQGLIQEEINRINRRPVLELKIHNVGKNLPEDYLYGVISNDGQEDAKDIMLQVVYEDSASEQLRLPLLKCHEHVAFKIGYCAPEGAEELPYTIYWSYVFDGDPERNVEEGALKIAQLPKPTFPVGVYNTQTIIDFYEDENGTVGNPNFFGRANETEKLRSLFEGDRFPGYKNAIVYGIRRAGKTTLLNYAQAYLGLKRPDVIAVKVDCLRVTGNHIVQKILVDGVLEEIAAKYGRSTETEDWQWLKQKWTLPEDAPKDRDPVELTQFYNDLKRVTGKGLILMLDEVDNFIASIERNASLDSSLFQQLSNMMCSATCQQAVHFILCGSKYLLRYRNGDGGLSQLFQRLGDIFIDVGLITKEEMIRMLHQPYKDYPEVKITGAAMDWIWEYTHGLVWQVKLLGNKVMEHVRENGRSVVYPTDVKDNVGHLINKAYCEQFYDGINDKEKDRRERLVVDAMQCLSPFRTSTVPKSVLLQVVTEMVTPELRMTADQLDRALENLVNLKLIQYSAVDRSYSFCVDLYRQYFRVQTQYEKVFVADTANPQSFINA